MLLGIIADVSLGAQTAPVPSPRDTVVAMSPVITQRVQAARTLLEQGEGDEARALLDSLVRTTPAGSLELAEVLYWRATLAERAADAERDWRRLVVEVPLSPRTSEVLLRLGDLEMLRQRPVQARNHFERVVREFPGTPQRVRAILWLARSHIEQREFPSGCRVFAALDRGAVPDGELQLQAEELRRQCASVKTDSVASLVPAAPAVAPKPATNAATSSPPSKASAASDARYSVQVGAYETEREAREMVDRMKGRGFEARVDGTERPYRVRIGRFTVRTDATKLMAQVKRIGIDAFVAELPR